MVWISERVMSKTWWKLLSLVAWSQRSTWVRLAPLSPAHESEGTVCDERRRETTSAPSPWIASSSILFARAYRRPRGTASARGAGQVGTRRISLPRGGGKDLRIFMPSSPSLAAQPGAGEPEPEPTADSKGRPFMCARSRAAPPSPRRGLLTSVCTRAAARAPRWPSMTSGRTCG